MNKKILVVFGLLLSFFALPVTAQKEPAKRDLSGAWILKNPKTKKIDGIKKKITLKLVIEDNDPLIKITELELVEDLDANGKPAGKKEGQPLVKVYYTDSRGESNVYEDGRTCESVTKRPKGSLWISKQDKEKNLTTVITFSLSENGAKLIVSSMTIKKVAKIDMPGKILPIKMASGSEIVFTKAVE